jgi:copper(I)-binding protein
MNFARLCVVVLALALSTTALAQVSVSDAWVRGTVAGQRATGAFMKLVAQRDVTLVAAASPLAASVELHEMKMDAGVMKMRAIDRLPLAKDASIELAPGGYHLMLMGLKQPAAAGASVPISLTFEERDGKRSTIEFAAPVRALTAAPGAMKH